MVSNSVATLSSKSFEVVDRFDGLFSGEIGDPWYHEAIGLVAQPNPEEVFADKFKSMDAEQIEAFAKQRLVKHLLSTAATIHSFRNRTDDAYNNSYNIEAMIKLGAKLGVTGEELEKLFSDVNIWKTITPHPTEHLNAAGIRLFRQLIEAQEIENVEQREAKVMDIVREMLKEDITPDRAQTVYEEIDGAVEQSRIHRAGLLNLFHRVNGAVAEAYEDYLVKPDLNNAKVVIDLALRTWHGADADGKPNADRWALMYGILAFMKSSIEDHKDDFEFAQVEIAKMASENGNALKAQYDQALGAFRNITGALGQLDGRIERLIERFVEIDDTGRKDRKENADFDVVKDDLDQLFVGLEIGGLKIDAQQDFERQLKDHLEMGDRLASDQARQRLNGSSFLFRQYGLTSAKMDTRHNGDIYKEMMNNLFSDADFRSALNGALHDGDGASFTDLPMDDQQRFMDLALKNLSVEYVKAALYRANPEVNDNGYVVQTHEFLRRLEIVGEFPGSFSMNIVADADAMSTGYQEFFGRVLSDGNLRHMPLNEEFKTLKEMVKSLKGFHEGSGGENVEQRILDHDGWAGDEFTQFLMIPCSDSNKKLGPLVRWLQKEGVQEAAREALALDIAILIKWGSGGAIARGGGDSLVYTRLLAQVLKQYTKETGRPLDPSKGLDRVFMKMATFVSSTEQGRMIRVYSSTPAQISTRFCDTIAEFMGRRWELEGRMQTMDPDGVMFIPPEDSISPRMREALDEDMDELMHFYGDVREAVDEDGNVVINSWAKMVSNQHMCSLSSNGARPPSKTSSKEFTDGRAIGSNIQIKNSRTNFDGYFTVGALMARQHQRYIDGKTSHHDLQNLMMKSEWLRRQVFLRGLMEGVQSDMSYVFKRLGNGDQWSFDRAIAVGKSVRIEEDTDSSGTIIKRIKYDNIDGSVSPEEALQALFFYDQACLAALNEASLAHCDEKDDNFYLYNRPLDEIIESVRPEDNSVSISYGERIKARYKRLQPLQDHIKDTTPDHVLVDECERRCAEDKDALPERVKRLVMSASRAATMPDHRLTFGKTAWGRRQAPNFAQIYLAHSPANNNNQNCGAPHAANG